MDGYNNVKYSKSLLLVFAYVQVSQEISACQKLYLTSKGVRQPVVLKVNYNCLKISQRGYLKSVDDGQIFTVKRV